MTAPVKWRLLLGNSVVLVGIATEPSCCIVGVSTYITSTKLRPLAVMPAYLCLEQLKTN